MALNFLPTDDSSILQLPNISLNQWQATVEIRQLLHEFGRLYLRDMVIRYLENAKCQH